MSDNAGYIAAFSQDFSQPADVRIRSIIKGLAWGAKTEGWDTIAMQGVNLVSCEPGKCIFELTVTSRMLNSSGNLHGGCSATLGDTLSSMAMVTLAKPGFLDTGHVSRTLTTTYFRPAPVGTKLRVYCEVLSVGKNLAHCRAEIKTFDDKAVVSVVHDKAIIPRSKMAKL